MTEFVPAILARDKKEFDGEKSRVDGLTDTLQIDFVDGEFSGNRTVTPEDLAGETFFGSVEAHLMVNDVPAWVKRLEALHPARIITPVETTADVAGAAEQVHQQGAEFGLAISPETGLETLRPHLGSVDRVLVLAVQPGYQGQSFHPETTARVEQLRDWAPELPIQVDGGVTPELVPELVGAGVTSIAVGHYEVDAADPDAALEALKKAAEGADGPD